MRSKLKYATLFGGAGNDKTSTEYLETIEIGKLLVDSGYIVKNGGYGGMMEAVSKGAFLAKGKTIGITCKEVGSEKGNRYLSETITTERLYDRLNLLIENTELFVVQKGGIGTLSEVFLTLDILRKKSEKERKIIFIGSIWSIVLAPILTNLVSKSERNLFVIVKNIEELKIKLLTKK